MRRPMVLAGAVTVLVALSAASCGNDDEGIATAEVGRADVVEIVDAPASVVARAAATLTSPAEGTLARLAVTAGDQVAKGQVVAVVDSPTAQQRLRDAKKALDLAKRSTGGGGVRVDLSGSAKHLDEAAAKAFDQARAAVAYIADPALKKALLAQVDAAEQQYAAASKAVTSAVRGVQRGLQSIGSAMSALGAAQKLQAQQAYDLAKATVDALTLRAPIAGVVQLGGASAPATSGIDLSSLLGAAGGGQTPSTGGAASIPGVSQTVPEGGLVTAGTAILTVVDVSELGLVAEVDETDILLVKPGLDAEVELDAATDVRYPSRVASIDVLPTANARGGVAYRVRLTLTPPSGAPTPRPGMNAVAHLRVRQANSAVAVPAAAVFTAEGQVLTWVRGPDGKAERRPVSVGVSGEDLVQITDGLQPGDRVVVRGTDKVHPGDELP
ncbi:multidrug efflux pump subunit AcrA (membrane-fusion protein) [Hamadaea flava]|uniref:Efflux RND transporter periplasmic adaptor subunit n=1 Tax=Hamadaea flava TaxID=1742688 RepID=A0ABV8LGV5_9ACTN|nr:efflux RND transporter periplasmic adaptor subunit [Hamadaea flava]MCP2326455.1 multidrug efflux pump subunit AcrA (membrane-fusion protein) [Hamadaea flava]